MYFEEYHANVTQTIAQMESENQALRTQLQDMTNLKQQVDSQKLNMQIVLDDAIREKERADLLRDKCHKYKAKLRQTLSETQSL